MTTPPPWQYLWTTYPYDMSARHKSGLIAQWRDGEVTLLHLDRVDARRWDVALLGAQARELLGDEK